jgi:thioredoxin 1
MSNAETTSSTVIEVTDDTFGDLVLSSSLGKAVLVDFWAQWCPPCHMLSPVLDEIAAELSDKLIVAKVNVDENQVTAQRYGILAMPTLTVFRNGEIISQVVGARPKRRRRGVRGAVPDPVRVAGSVTGLGGRYKSALRSASRRRFGRAPTT